MDEAQNRFNFNRDAPWNLLNQYTSILGGTSGLLGGAGSGTKTTPYYTNPVSGLLGMAGTGVNIASQLGLFGGGAAATTAAAAAPTIVAGGAMSAPSLLAAFGAPLGF